ncbi:MAG TPA: hypothetical protein VFP71_12215 [Candidatus Angelobacter sp.]|nr:hypothetical protein [Candidatus Angelobacter sp.]
MTFKRPTNRLPLSKTDKLDLLKDYIEHYRQLATTDKTALNRKVPRGAFNDLLNRVGDMLLAESAKLAESAGPIRTFLNTNPLPQSMAERLPDDFRVFCLALNSLKQWVAAEQSATDRFLLGGVARELCREAAEHCLITGEIIGQDSELHHPVRDGRPPILLSKKGHAAIEGQQASMGDDPIGKTLWSLRREKKWSWMQLRRGCLDLLGKPVPWPSKASTAGARTIARNASARARVGYEQILNWLDSKGL